MAGLLSPALSQRGFKMPRPKKITLDVADANLTGFASNVTGATWTLSTTATTDSLAHQVSIRNDSITDHSGKTALLTGTDADDKAITETVTLPGASATVESSLYFKTLTSIVPSATIGSDTMDIGWVDEVVSKTYPINWRGGDMKIGIIITGTMDVTLQHTFDDVQDATIAASQGAMAWINTSDSNAVNATASVNSFYDYLPRAARLVVNSYSSGAEVDITFIQQDF